MSQFYFLDLEETMVLFDILETDGITDIRFVGGCVRDSLLGKMTDDLDLAINAPIEKVIEILGKNDILCIKSGMKYGSIRAIIRNRSFDITSLRVDTLCYGRDCEIRLSNDYLEDALRRDFTINAMYVSKDGEFFDYLHGEEDLKNGRVTFIGNPLDRIREDALRILRYYRFCAYLRDYSHSYAKVLQQTAHLIKKLSIERIQYELFRTIHSNTVINTMYNDEVLRVISKDASIEAFNRINNAETTDIIRICALFPFEFVLGVLRIKKDERQLVKKYKKFLFEDLDYCFYKEGIQFAGDMAIIKLAKLNIPINNSLKFKGMEKFPLTYHDLPTCTKNASKILRACEKWWVGNGGINTKEECLEYVKTIDLSI